MEATILNGKGTGLPSGKGTRPASTSLTKETRAGLKAKVSDKQKAIRFREKRRENRAIQLGRQALDDPVGREQLEDSLLTLAHRQGRPISDFDGVLLGERLLRTAAGIRKDRPDLKLSAVADLLAASDGTARASSNGNKPLTQQSESDRVQSD